MNEQCKTSLQCVKQMSLFMFSHKIDEVHETMDVKVFNVSMNELHYMVNLWSIFSSAQLKVCTLGRSRDVEGGMYRLTRRSGERT